jgi:type IV secretory pathway VirB6-like protein
MIYEVRKDFWGLIEERAPTSKERKKKIIEILNSAYCKNSQKFHFSVGPVRGSYLEVCEPAIAIMLGISRSSNKGEITNQWLRQRKYLVTGKIDKIDDVRLKRYNSKKEKVSTYVEYMGNIFCETSPLAGFIIIIFIYIIIFIIIKAIIIIIIIFITILYMITKRIYLN